MRSFYTQFNSFLRHDSECVQKSLQHFYASGSGTIGVHKLDALSIPFRDAHHSMHFIKALLSKEMPQ